MNFDFYELTRKIGKPSCVLLYAYFGYLAGRKKPLPLLILLGLHTYEYFSKARYIAQEHGIDRLPAIANCLAFGFTWWLPIKKGDE